MKIGIFLLTFFSTLVTLSLGITGESASPSAAKTASVRSLDGPVFDLSTFGAVGDGVANDGPALQQALNAIAQEGGGTLFVPAGRYAITTPVFKDFTGTGASLTILGVASSTPVNADGDGAALTRGLDLTSEFVIRTGLSTTALTLRGLDSLLISDMVFIGTPGVATD
ncbi:MAG TPA: glycosyl hydrolase family 28-related protein, partial [Pyrinomonadaceae bacterium]|nr:glycosyl hydrolase family 28-related protein [Pyrinomonadaceae bacterium]